MTEQTPPAPVQTQPQTADIISWNTEEFVQHSRTPLWYVGFTIVTAGLLIFAFYTESIITMVLFGLVVVLAFIFAHKPPRNLTHQLTPTGIILGDVVFPYKHIKTFWIIYNPPSVKTLNLETTAYLNPHVAIQLGDMDPLVVKNFLNRYLPEDLEREEALVDVVSRHLKI